MATSILDVVFFNFDKEKVCSSFDKLGKIK